jgi:hypothetical protein
MVNVMTFNACRMILDLLDDTNILGGLGNLVVNHNNPFMAYNIFSNVPKEILDGT